MNIIKNLITTIFLLDFLFSIHGKIVFYDGTYVVGKVTKVDESSVYIIPIGLDTAEGVLIGNIDSLKMENGMVPIISSSVKYFFQNGEFLRNDSDWMDEEFDFKYNDYTTLQEPYKYEETKKRNQQYYQVSAFSSYPVISAISLKEEDGTSKLVMNLGASFQLPYYPVGALDVSPGLRLMTYGYETTSQGKVQAINLAAFSTFDFKPVFYFIPEALHLSTDIGVNYNFAYDLDQRKEVYPGVETLNGDETYSGLGIYAGASADYWMPELPLAFRFFFNGYVVPQAPPFTNERTFFGSVGLSAVVVLKRHHQNNTK